MDNPIALREFYDMVSVRLNAPDKLKKFKSYLDFPIDTVSVTGEAFNLLEKVYDGRDPVYHWHFNDKDIEEDWHSYRERSKLKQFWREEAWSRLKSRFNSIMVIDAPQEQKGARPEPYVYFVDIANVMAYDGKDDQFDWVIYKLDGLRYVHLDDGHYQIFNLDTGDSSVYASEELRSEHGMSKCPSRFFLSELLKEGENGVMKSPLSGEVGNLNYLQFIMTNKKMADSYGANPIYWQYTKECDFTRLESGSRGEDGDYVSCRGGNLIKSDGHYLMQGANPAKCPVCAESSLTGAGSLIEVDPPTSKEDPLITPPAGIIQGDVAILKFLVDEEERRRNKFITAVTGNPIEVTSDQAVNVMQVMSLMEQGKAAILKVKRALEQANQWADSMLCEFRYGDHFKNCSINYGTEFFIVGADMMMNLYIEARAKKLDGTILDGLLDQYFETKHRHNPEKLQRELMISNIDPFRHLWEDTITAMYEKGYIEYPDYMMKINLTSYIKQFERENGDITHFGSHAYDDNGVRLSFSRRIELIREVISGYAGSPRIIKPLKDSNDE